MLKPVMAGENIRFPGTRVNHFLTNTEGIYHKLERASHTHTNKKYNYATV